MYTNTHYQWRAVCVIGTADWCIVARGLVTSEEQTQMDYKYGVQSTVLYTCRLNAQLYSTNLYHDINISWHCCLSTKWHTGGHLFSRSSGSHWGQSPTICRYHVIWCRIDSESATPLSARPRRGLKRLSTSWRCQPDTPLREVKVSITRNWCNTGSSYSWSFVLINRA